MSMKKILILAVVAAAMMLAPQVAEAHHGYYRHHHGTYLHSGTVVRLGTGVHVGILDSVRVSVGGGYYPAIRPHRYVLPWRRRVARSLYHSPAPVRVQILTEQ